MNPFEMVVAIVIVVTAGRVLRARFSGRSGPAREIETTRLQEEVRALKERVAVLERVITDTEGRLSLEREIEKLRDKDHV